jgi:hypothetical protein
MKYMAQRHFKRYAGQDTITGDFVSNDLYGGLIKAGAYEVPTILNHFCNLLIILNFILGAKKGIYTSGTTLTVEDARLIAWLTESSLHTRANGSVPLKELIDAPNLFPFQIKPIHAEGLVAAPSRLDMIRHGLDEDLIMLRKSPTKGGAA